MVDLARGKEELFHENQYGELEMLKEVIWEN